MIRFLKFSLTVAVIIGIGCATNRIAITPIVWPERPKDAPLVRIILDPIAAKQLEALADSTRKTRKEQSACVTIYGYLPTARNSVVVAIMEVGPTIIDYISDSLYVAVSDSTQRLCEDDEPIIHTHIVKNSVWGRPSPFDSMRSKLPPFPPFHVLVSVDSVRPSKVTIYGLRGAP